jgi:hypothetical protein
MEYYGKGCDRRLSSSAPRHYNHYSAFERLDHRTTAFQKVAGEIFLRTRAEKASKFERQQVTLSPPRPLSLCFSHCRRLFGIPKILDPIKSEVLQIHHNLSQPAKLRRFKVWRWCRNFAAESSSKFGTARRSRGVTVAQAFQPLLGTEKDECPTSDPSPYKLTSRT